MSREYDFDRAIERRGSQSVKWNRYGGRDVLPLWVADMDFQAPAPVIAALKRRVEHGIFGYTHASKGLTEAALAYLRERHRWTIEPDWLVWLPGTVPAIHAACRLIAHDAAAVTTTPIYPPFRSAAGRMGQACIEAPLAAEAARAVLDLDHLEAGFADNGRLFLFCNPHNPTGRVFTRAELEALAERLLRHDVLIVSDELHCDLVLEPDARHLPLAAAVPELAARTITLYAPSKTFNLAGLGLGCAVIPDPGLRKRFKAAIEGVLPYVNALAYAAAEAAWREGWNWHAALIRYLRANRDRVTDTLSELPGVRATPPEATYLYWLDLRDTGIENPVAQLERHGLGLSDGADFGAPGFARLNFACPRATLDTALVRLSTALR
ncbi:MAG: MalY/PatB family protein [Acetobacteraceae bacterium]